MSVVITVQEAIVLGTALFLFGAGTALVASWAIEGWVARRRDRRREVARLLARGDHPPTTPWLAGPLSGRRN